ncbi:LacI family DNA-binding transcriptional regulator [Microbacterium sp. T2.11-28]|uniref:LacI family DNA-binding transcriptional regulator n=1 Tax=Microbacterium sp. T2.11-28 TaxID=3041169 RepID=UPI002477AF35|nr:LacI family DNA-binding transcriptional regulator [Microbacterium sp. T2.11-28]CAI9389626.1 HTH-type transcriptional regulator IpsA [Microbacterium sp. T2.11-28]
MNSRRATIADVAREAGVSPSTASVVFSGKTPVSDATRARVLDAAAALGYTGPDPLAASLRRGRSGIVGVLQRGPLGIAFTDPVQRTTMDGLADAVASVDASLLLLRPVPGGPVGDSGTAPGPATGAATLATVPLDAAVLIGTIPEAAADVAALRARGVPVVVIEGDAGEGVPRIGLDNHDAERCLAEHVRRLGHTDVAIVTLRSELNVTHDRLGGARDVFPDAPAFATLASSIDEGLRVGRQVFAAGRPTAVLAQSDLLAAGVIRAAEEAGLSVPGDVSVAGFDGVPVDGLAPYELTTMVQPAVEKGRAAGAAVVAMLLGEQPASVTFTSVFRAGNTTGPVPESRGVSPR